MTKRAASAGPRAVEKQSSLGSHRPEIQVRVVQATTPATYEAEAIVVGAFTDGPLSGAARAIDTASKGKLTTLVQRGDLAEKPGASIMLYDVPGATAQRVLLVSFGPRKDFGDRAFRDALAGAADALRDSKARSVAVALADVDIPNRPLAWRLQLASRVLADGCYRFNAPKGNGEFDRGARDIEVAAYEPKMNVTPNAVALKDD